MRKNYCIYDLHYTNISCENDSVVAHENNGSKIISITFQKNL